MTLAESSGINRWDGQPLRGWGHVVQSLEVLWTTRIGERVMREEFGNPGVRLLGENMTPPNILRFWQAVKVVTDLWEPRFTITQIFLLDPNPEEQRMGHIRFEVRGIYRPRGHLGDRTPERQESLFINRDGSLSV